MAKVVLVGYGQMLYSLIGGIETSKTHKILGVFRADRTKYSSFKLFFKDIFAPSYDYTIIKFKKLYDIKGNSVNSKKFIEEIKRLNPDLIIVGSWGEKFESGILNTVPVVNFHPALLPRNRGANPYFWVIYNNEKITGLTAHYMNEYLDRGDILLQAAIDIDSNETGQTLKDKTTFLARSMVQKLLDLYDKNELNPTKQDESKASYQYQLKNENFIINLEKSKDEVYRHLRAIYPWGTPKVRAGWNIVQFKDFEFLDDDGYFDKNIGEIIKNNKEYTILKGSNFLIKIYK